MIAKRANIPASATVEMVAKVNELKKTGIDIIDLGSGEPGQKTPLHVRELAKKALDHGHTRYCEAAGIIELREALAEKLSSDNGIDVAPSDILVTVGGKEGVFLAMQALVDPGEKVVLTDPSWLTYDSCIRMAGGIPCPVVLDESNEFRMHLHETAKVLDAKTKMIVINSPNNPTGSVLSKDDLEGIAEIAIRNDLYVLSDEVYEYIVYEGTRHVSIASLPEMIERTIIVNSFSKSYAMTGWRLGYVVAPKRVMRYLKAIHEHSVTGPCTFAQVAAAEALRDKRSKEFIKMMTSEYERKRDIMIRALEKTDAMSCVKPRGTFYAFPNTSCIRKNSTELASYLLEEARVATIPGIVFGPHGENHLRMTFTNPDSELEEATSRIADAVRRCT